ncbi:MAG: NUDIX domain-containing protein [Chitinophagaceae bacterium]
MEKPKIIAGGGLVFNPKNELLMIFRLGFWDLPKGKWEEGETIEECAVREVEEETGLHDVQLGKLVGLTYHEYFNKYTQEDVIKETHWFAMSITDEQVPTPQTSEDIEQAVWVPLDAVDEKLPLAYPTIREIVSLVKS